MSDSKWTIKKVDESDPMALWLQYKWSGTYARSDGPQPVFILVDHDQKEIRTYIEAEPQGSGYTVFGDHIERFAVPAGAMPSVVNRLMDEIKEALERGEWDGDTADFDYEFLTPDDTNQAVWDCEDYFDSDTHLAMLTEKGKTIDDVRADIESHAGKDKAFLGIEGYLEALVQEAAEGDS